MRIGLGELIFSLVARAFVLLPIIVCVLLIIALVKYLRKK
jgi:hypothetical protein